MSMSISGLLVISPIEVIWKIIQHSLFLFIFYQVGHSVYNVYFHPLSQFPGPVMYTASRLPYVIDLVRGNIVKTVTRAHDKYGDVVRIAPNELSFISGETAWSDIYGFRQGKKPEFSKSPEWYFVSPNGVRSMLSATREDHTRVRRVFSHAFSERSVREQQPLIQKYADMLIQRLYEKAQAGVEVNLLRYYQFTGSDVMGDITFGESFGCLETDDYVDHVKRITSATRAMSFRMALKFYKIFEFFYMRFTPAKTAQAANHFHDFVKGKIYRRRALETTRPDIMTVIERQPECKGLTDKEVVSNAELFLLGGSETVSTVLSGATFLLLKHPSTMKRLSDEILNSFRQVEDIRFDSLSRLPYLQAVLNETLRLYPPIPTGFPRVVPPSGGHIGGRYVPGDTWVYVGHYAAYHSPRNFTHPNSFIPERWMEDSKGFELDNKAAWKPFSDGPRNCIGKNLALAEMRLILTRIIWNFELQLADPELDWLDQKVYNIWVKRPLPVRLTLRQRS